MHCMRSALVGLVVVAGAAAVASAQVKPRAARVGKGRPAATADAQTLDRALFRGIQLSDAEKANIQAVREQYKPQFKSLQQSLRPNLQAARAARQSGDMAAARAKLQKTAAQREQTKRLTGQMRADYRNALMPQNQAKFDSNVS